MPLKCAGRLLARSKAYKMSAGCRLFRPEIACDVRGVNEHHQTLLLSGRIT